PSLLPDNRGPDPLFWTFHAGARETGVTIHLMDAGLDSGPILAQERAALADGETEEAMEARLATLAADLMTRALAGLASGALRPTPQDAAHATRHGWPSADDYAIDAANWSARRAWVFARGMSGRGQPLILTTRDGARFHLLAALGYDERGADDAAPWTLADETLTVACAPGVLQCRATQLADE
ncbi:MAG TPA: formyltransferase family protein, partial [Ktedonobacterales bacterium]